MESVMETVLNKIFSSCDPSNTGTTSVSKIIDCITPFMQSNLSDLRELRRLLNTNDSGDEIVTKTSFEQAMKSWVAMYQDPSESCIEIANTSLFTDFDEKSSATQQPKIGERLLEGYACSLNISTCGDAFKDKSFFENRIKELEHLNRKLSDELVQHKIQEQVCEETIENLKMSLANIHQKLAITKHTVETLEKDLHEYDELREKHSKLTQKTDKLEKLTNTMEKEMQNLKQKNENLKNEKKSLLDQANLKDKKENDLEKSLNYLHDQLLDKSDLVELLSSDNDILKMNNSEQKKYAVELQNIIDDLKCNRLQSPKNKNDILDRRAVQESVTKSPGVLTQNLNLQDEIEEYDCSFDKSTLQGQLNAIEHRCCKESKKRLSNQVDLLNIKLDKQKDCINMYIDQIKDCEQTIKDCNSKESNLIDLIEDVKAKLKKQEKLTMEKDLEINKLNLDMAEIDSYASKVKAEFENNFLTNKNLDSKLKDLQIVNNNIMEQNKKLQEKLDFINQSKLHLEQENKSLKMSESECDIIKAEFEQLESTQRDLKNKLSEVCQDNQKLEKTIKELNETNQILEKRNNEIIDCNKVLLKDSDELNKKLDLKIKEMQTHHERKLEELTIALDLKKLDFERVSHELSLSQRNFTTIKDEKNQLLLQINLLEVRSSEINKWNHSLKLEKEQLNDELTVSLKKLKNREEQHANLKTKYNELNRQKCDCSKTMDDYERKIRCLENEIRKLQGVNEDNCLKILDYEEKLASASEKQLELSEVKTDLNCRLNQTKNNLEKLELTIKELLQNEETLQNTCDHLKLNNHNLESQNTKLQNEISKLTTISTTFCENCTKLEEKLKRQNKCEDLNSSRRDSYGKLSLRLERVQNKLDSKEAELNQSQIMILDLKEKLSNADPNFSTPRSSSNDDLEFLIRQLTVDRLILQSALNAFVTKWRTALKKIPKAAEIINFVENEDETSNKKFPNNFKELHILTKYISLIVLALTIINELKPNPLNNLNTKTNFALKPALFNVDFSNTEQGTGDNYYLNPDYQTNDDLLYNTTESSPSLTDAVLESLQLSGDSSIPTGNISDDNSRLEYRICQLMVSFRLDSETVASRHSAQAQARDRMDNRLLEQMRNLMRMIEDMMSGVCAGGGEIKEEGVGQMLRAMQKKLQQINVLCCRTVQSAEQLGALHHEFKMHKALHLITNYVSRLEKIISDQKVNTRTKTIDISIIKPRKSATKMDQPKFTILRSFESSTQTSDNQRDKMYYFLIVSICFCFGLFCSIKTSISQNMIPWHQITWDEIFDQIFEVKYLSGRPM